MLHILLSIRLMCFLCRHYTVLQMIFKFWLKWRIVKLQDDRINSWSLTSFHFLLLSFRDLNSNSWRVFVLKRTVFKHAFKISFLSCDKKKNQKRLTDLYLAIDSGMPTSLKKKKSQTNINALLISHQEIRAMSKFSNVWLSEEIQLLLFLSQKEYEKHDKHWNEYRLWFYF